MTFILKNIFAFKMVVMQILLLYFFISEISSYTLTKIDVFKDGDYVRKIHFDAQGNGYAAVTTMNGTDEMYKLNSSNEVLFVVDLSGYPTKMYVSSRGDVYLELIVGAQKVFAFLDAGLTFIKEIDDDELSFRFFYLDNSDNFFYWKEKKEVYVRRSNSSLAVPVTNLENTTSISSHLAVSDKSGNTYFVTRREGKDSLVLISNETLQNKIPEATITNLTSKKDEFTIHLAVDGENTLWLAITDYNSKESFIKKFKNGNLKTVLTEQNRIYSKLLCSGGRTYVVARNFDDSSIHSIFYMTPIDEVVEIPQLKDFKAPPDSIFGFADNEGNTYFYLTESDFSSSLGRMVVIKPNATEPIPITFGTSAKVNFAKLDFNDDLWIFTVSKDLFQLKKGETVAVLRNNFNESCESFRGQISFNFATKKVYFLCANGLFIAENI